MLPPPCTTATSTPRSCTPLICAAMALTRSGSVPYSRSPMSASPDSFRRMRSKAGRFTGALRPDREAGEAADDDVLAGRAGELGAQLLDRLAVVLVGIDVLLLEQHDLFHPLAKLALGDLGADVLRLVGGLLLEHAQLGLLVVLRDVLLGDVAHHRRGGDVQRDLAREADEVVVPGDEVGVAVDLDEHADLAVAVDVGLDRPLGGLPAAHLQRLVAEPDAQQLDGLVDVAVRLRKRRLAVHHAGAGAVAQLLDFLRRRAVAHFSSFSSSVFSTAPLTAPAASAAAPATAPSGPGARSATASATDSAAPAAPAATSCAASTARSTVPFSSSSPSTAAACSREASATAAGSGSTGAAAFLARGFLAGFGAGFEGVVSADESAAAAVSADDSPAVVSAEESAAAVVSADESSAGVSAGESAVVVSADDSAAAVSADAAASAAAASPSAGGDSAFASSAAAVGPGSAAGASGSFALLARPRALRAGASSAGAAAASDDGAPAPAGAPASCGTRSPTLGSWCCSRWPGPTLPVAGMAGSSAASATVASAASRGSPSPPWVSASRAACSSASLRACSSASRRAFSSASRRACSSASRRARS